MSGIYTVVIPETSVSAQVDLIEFVAHATRPFIILELHLHQITDKQDAHEELLAILLKSGQTTSGSGGNAAAAANSTEGGLGTSGFTAETLNTTKATAGTILTHASWSWNTRGPFDLVFTELSQFIMGATRRATLELGTTPGQAITLGGYALVQEIGS